MKLKVGITGQAGFMGTHLANSVRYLPTEIELVPFEDDFFKEDARLKEFALRCDCIVHLAAMNRTKGKPEEIYECNIGLVKQLIRVLEESRHTPHVIFSSSTQEEKDNVYGRSKREGRVLFEEWASRNKAPFTGMVIPNVFGPFGVPYFNSVVSTFCYQVTHGIEPAIEVDADMNLIDINTLIAHFHNIIRDRKTQSPLPIAPVGQRRVSAILEQIVSFREIYLRQGIIPDLRDPLDLSLFNTFRTYIDPGHYPFLLQLRTDDRGHLFEVIKSPNGGQTFFSVTKPGITRGNHFHTRKIERFCVVRGEGRIRIRRIGTNDVVEYTVSGAPPSFVDMPVFHTHNITNIGPGEMETLFWSNEIFNPNDTDTFYEEV